MLIHSKNAGKMIIIHGKLIWMVGFFLLLFLSIFLAKNFHGKRLWFGYFLFFAAIVLVNLKGPFLMLK